MSKHNDDSVLFRLKNMEDLEPSEAFVTRLEETLVQKARQMDKLGRMRRLVPVIGTSFAAVVLGIWLSFFNGVEVVNNGFNPEPVLFEGTKPTIEETINQLTYKIQQPSFLPIDVTFGTANINILASHNDQEIQIFYYNQQNGEVFGIGVNRIDHFLPVRSKLIETDNNTQTEYYLYDDLDQQRVLYWKDDGLYYRIHGKRPVERENGYWDVEPLFTADELIEIAKSFSYEAKPYTRLTSNTFEKVNYENVRKMVKKSEALHLDMEKEYVEKLFGYGFAKYEINAEHLRNSFTQEQIDQLSLKEFWRLDYAYNNEYQLQYNGAENAEPDKLGLWQRDIGLQLFLWWTEEGTLGHYEVWYVLENEKEVYAKGISKYDYIPYEATLYARSTGSFESKYVTQRPTETLFRQEKGMLSYNVQDDSMQRDGKFPKSVVIEKREEAIANYTRGDIVVFGEIVTENGESRLINPKIARVVGLPGEAIGLSAGYSVTINNKELLTFYGKPGKWKGEENDKLRTVLSYKDKLTVPSNSYFLMSDNWYGDPIQESVHNDRILGRVIASWGR